MTDANSMRNAVNQALRQFLNWACITHYPINYPFTLETFMQEESVKKIFYLLYAPDVDLTPALQGIGEKLPEMDVARGCFAGYIIGVLSERGISTKASAISLLEHFIECVDLCYSFNSHRRAFSMECINEFKASSFMNLLSTAVLALITQEREFRDYLRAKEDLLSQIKVIMSDYDNLCCISKVIEMPEQETVIFLHLELNKGCEVEIKYMDNNFALFTWFQMELYHRGLLHEFGVNDFIYNQRVDELIHRSLGNFDYSTLSRSLIESACFGYIQCTARSLKEDGSAFYDMTKFVLGEESIYYLPKLDGKFVILLSNEKRIGWSGLFIGGVHDNLLPNLKILRMLSQEEVEEWKSKIHKK